MSPYFGTAKASTIFSGVCLNSWPTAARAASARSCNDFDSTRRGYWTVTETNVPFRQLNPTCGRTPVDCSRSLSTAFACLKPSVMVLTASQAASVRANTRAAAILIMNDPRVDLIESGVGAAYHGGSKITIYRGEDHDDSARAVVDVRRCGGGCLGAARVRGDL